MNNFLDYLTILTGRLSGYAWGVPSIILLVGTGLYLTLRLGFIQIRGFRHSFQLITGKFDQESDPGEVTHFQALSTALSATIGTGNIAGVATAIAFGGPGAVFWMWVTAMVGMATKFTSCLLALKFRTIHENGEVSGGPMYTLKNGLNMPKFGGLFAVFALIASFGIGNMVQANSVVDGLGFIMPQVAAHKLMLGVVMAIMVGLVIIGGIKRIAKVASRIVPFMAIVYSLAAVFILILNFDRIPAAFATIFNHALNPWAAGGGAMGAALQYGVARGVFSNESGLGSAPMAHAAARTREPVREGLVAMIGPFIDTIVICSMTALVIIVSGVWGAARPDNLQGAALSAYAFQQTLGPSGAWIVGFGLVFFAYTTIIAWSYYGDRSAEYLFGARAVMPYRIIYTVLVVVGAYIPLKLVWNFADIANILMAVPNLISLILLAGVVKGLSKDYFDRMSPAAAK
ncbi:Sodium/glycine symporter GlyP [hydrothermal vent metagenome]|uniref:Sodium/glycine symporter GlyP n=1 Tax=hydrothermal vent metagenome TaxID=652676 RepID=A0A3B0VKG9_9ZZZZ